METIKEIWKDIKELDAQIRIIEYSKDTQTFYVSIGLFESLGEQAGEITQLLYKHNPTEKEIIEDIKEELKEARECLDITPLSSRGERQLKVLNKLNL